MTMYGASAADARRAHARSGDAVAIASYLGSSDAFDRALATFAEAYADQNEADSPDSGTRPTRESFTCNTACAQPTPPAGAPPEIPAAEQLQPPADRRLETPRAAGVAGLAFAVLFVTSIVLLRNHPSDGSTAAEIQDFYLRDEADSVALVGVYLVGPSPGSRSCGSSRRSGI